jgi:hypothetical protein
MALTRIEPQKMQTITLTNRRTIAVNRQGLPKSIGATYNGLTEVTTQIRLVNARK